MADKGQYDGPDLYHYTSEEGAKGILKDKVIRSTKTTKQNLDNDMLLGPGVYATSMGPSHSKEEILRNNYPQSLQSQVAREGKADYYFKSSKETIQREMDNGTRVFQSETPGREKIFVLQDPKDIKKEKN